MGALKIIVQTLCAGLTAAAVYGAETNVLTKAEQKKLNRIGMKAATRLERTSGKLIEVSPVKAKASRLASADLPLVQAAVAKAGILSSDVPLVLEAIAKAGILANDAPSVLAAIAKAGILSSDVPLVLEAIAKAGILANDVPSVLVAIAKAGILSSDVPLVLEAIAKAGILANDVPSVLVAIAKAGVATTDAITVVRLAGIATAATAANMPVFQRINHVVTMIAYNYVFVWRDDKDLVFPDLATRQASRDTFFGGLEKQIAEACKTNDTERAGMLMRDYVDKWDNVYKVQRKKPADRRRGN